MDVSMLKGHLGDDLFTQVEGKLGSLTGYQVIPTNDGSWLPKSKLDEEIQKRKDLQSTINSLTKDLTDANTKLAESSSLQSKVDQLTKDLASRDAEITGMKRSGKIREKLTKANARDISVVEKLLDDSKIKENDKGELTGVDEQIDEMKKASPYLFSDTKPNNPRGGFGDNRQNHSGGDEKKGNADINSLIRAAAGRSE